MAWNDSLDEGTPAYILASTNAHTVRAVAGPGSGKSFAIKRRISRLLEQGVDPKKILAITFTRTAAQDLKREISSLGINGAEEVHSRTLHSHALKILMKAEVLERTGRTPRMVIDHEIVPALRDLDKEEYGGIKDKKKLLDSFLAGWAQLQNDTPGFTKSDVQTAFEYDLTNWLTSHGGILVGEVIPVALDFLRNNPASPFRNSYDVILVDEYQDLNRSEQEFIKLIRGNANLIIVGDDDQSIYSFKFAHPEGIQQLHELHGEYLDVPFEECRRCPTDITKMASELISKNTNRTLGELKAHKHNHGGIVQIAQWKTYDDEIEGISKIILSELAKEVIKPEDVLVLTPRRRIGYKLRDMLIAAKIPTKSYFRESAISKEKVKRAYSLFNLLANPDDLISLRFLLGFGSSDSRKSQYSKLHNVASSKGISISETLDFILKGTYPDTGLKTIIQEYRNVQTDLAKLKNELIKNPTEGLQNMFINTEEDEFEFYELNQLYLKAVDEISAEQRDDSREFIAWVKEVFNKLQESIALMDSPDSIDHVRIMSLHASKGLSAKFVILCSMIDHLIPFVSSDLTQQESFHAVEEQRRLFYVAVTRCKSSTEYQGRLIISSFISISGLEAVRMGIPADTNYQLTVSSTRYLKDFGNTIPKPIVGEEIAL